MGVLDRLILSDDQWERISPHVMGDERTHGSSGCDLPDAFGEWNTAFCRFSRWSEKGVWQRIFAAMSDDPDFEYLVVDSTIVRAHQPELGAPKRRLTIKPSHARAAT